MQFIVGNFPQRASFVESIIISILNFFSKKMTFFLKIIKWGGGFGGIFFWIFVTRNSIEKPICPKVLTCYPPNYVKFLWQSDKKPWSYK